MKIGSNPKSEKERIAKESNEKLRSDKKNIEETDKIYEDVVSELFDIEERKLEEEEAKKERIVTEPEKFDEDIIITSEEEY